MSLVKPRKTYGQIEPYSEGIEPLLEYIHKDVKLTFALRK